jgi:hypothetical protein
MGLGERLDAIRGEAAEGGVSLAVDLHGKLVALDFDRQALAMRPDDLARLVRDLADRAAAAALAEGMAAVADVVPAGWLEDARVSGG